MKLVKEVQILIVSILLFTCKSEQKTTEKTSDTIILMFKNSPEINNSFQFTENIVINPESTQISIFGSTDDRSIELPKIQIPDDVILKAKKDYVILRHPINYIDYNDYLLMKGDSVTINYRNGLPVVSVLNRKISVNDFNAENISRDYILNKSYSPVAEYFNARTINAKRMLVKKESPNNKKKLSIEQTQEIYNHQIQNIKNELRNDAQLYIDKENNILDSLRKNQLISAEPYHLYKNKLKNIGYIIRMETGHLSEKQIYKTIRAKENHSYFPPIYHQQLIEAFTDKFIASKAKVAEIGDGRNRDFNQVYAMIDTANVFLGNDKSYLLYRELRKIAETSSNKEFITYFKKFERTVNDTVLTNKIRSDYSVKFSEESNNTKSLTLFDSLGRKFSFDEVKKRYIGKIIYVDFWASWCAPCRRTLPQSAKLRDELKGKKIVFVYLSIDQTIKPWYTASRKEQLYNYAENYLIANYRVSDFVKQQKLNTIPRYMIFDKEGNLTYPNAPRVESRELKALLIKLSES